MKKTHILKIFILILFVIKFSGCSNEKKINSKTLIGDWEQQGKRGWLTINENYFINEQDTIKYTLDSINQKENKIYLSMELRRTETLIVNVISKDTLNFSLFHYDDEYVVRKK